MSESRPGRPREYASDADRVRAWRARQKEKSGSTAAESTEAPTDPIEASATLAQSLPLLRQEAERLSAVAARITESVNLLGDPAAVDAHLRRAQVAADKVRADAAAEIEQLRDQLDTAVDDRINADAAAQAAEQAAEQSATQLAEANADHAEQLRAMESSYRERLAEQEQLVESLRTRATELGDEVAQIRGAADRASAASAATIGRLESDLGETRVAVQAERTRTDDIRDELAAARADLAAARTQTEASRERVEELRAELADIRGRTTS
jgi:chromosome segregation ATPase